MPDLSHGSIALLDSKWNDLHDLDRAQAIKAILCPDISINQIARELKRSSALLRHLLVCLEASAEDQELARQGLMSTNKLAKRGLAARKQREEPSPEVVKAQREESTRVAVDLICDWIEAEGLNGHHGEAVIKGASDRIVVVQRNPNLPAVPKKVGILPEVLIRRHRPKQPPDGGVARINWYVLWLARWAYSTFEDPVVREDALKQALKRQDERQLRKPSQRD